MRQEVAQLKEYSDGENISYLRSLPGNNMYP